MPYPPMLPVMYVRATDASGIDLEEDVMGIGELRDRSVFEENVFESSEDERVVLLLLVSESLAKYACPLTRSYASIAMTCRI
jgi:hypothetical protein